MNSQNSKEEKSRPKDDEIQEFKKYIVFYSERCVIPQCNYDNVCLVESPIFPTEHLLRENGMIVTGSCGYENCSGSHLVDFRVEDYSSERARELELTAELEIAKYGNSRKMYYDCKLHRLTPKTRIIPQSELHTSDGLIIKISKIEKIDG